MGRLVWCGLTCDSEAAAVKEAMLQEVLHHGWCASHLHPAKACMRSMPLHLSDRSGMSGTDCHTDTHTLVIAGWTINADGRSFPHVA